MKCVRWRGREEGREEVNMVAYAVYISIVQSVRVGRNVEVHRVPPAKVRSAVVGGWGVVGRRWGVGTSSGRFGSGEGGRQ